MERHEDIMADPPIDDDDYNYGDQKFPTSVQVHLIYAAYSLSAIVSRVWEAACPMLVALCFQQTLVASTIYAAVFAVVGPQLEGYARARVVKNPRLRLMRNIIFQHRVFPIIALILLVLVYRHTLHGISAAASILAIMGCTVVSRAATITQLMAIESDWTHIMSNEQSGVCDAIIYNLQLVSFASSLAGPAIAGGLICWLGLESTTKTIIFMLVVSMVVECSFMFQLYSTCYALSVPRPPQTDFNMGYIIPGMTTRKVLQYITMKPRPVLCSLGIILVKSSIICLGPQFLFYMLTTRQMPAILVGIYTSLQLATYIVPHLFGYKLAALVDALVLGLIAWFVFSGVVGAEYIIGALILSSRYCLLILDQAAQTYVDDLVNDRAVLVIFRKAEVHTLRILDCASQCLTLIWYKPETFFIPVVISGSFSLMGIALFAIARSH